uniref:NADH-ubiquinone oxidoreductase chain 4 n=1 Tax=Caprella scaura TaxID=703580 RepID=E2RVN4_9CRUS|nr:NADH dehydrogenase subunit 4 [Caprella scaura]BAJ23208.1 NADH dehydrogenase subunit 4 [Caprella scaura]
MLNFLFMMGCSLFFCSWSTCLVSVTIYLFFYMLFSYESFLFKTTPFFELDIVGLSLILLSLWVVILSLLGSQYIKINNSSVDKFLVCLGALTVFLVGTFSFSGYMSFYIGFECSVLPVLFLILGWGYQPERVQAGLYLLFYTMLASLPFLLLITSAISSSLMVFMCEGFNGSGFNGVYCLVLLGAFLVKYPMYGVHLWLPKAHVEAPVSGSMILAGVLLKLGGYGMIRFMPLILMSPQKIFWGLISVSLVGGVYMSFVCLSQMDMKSLIACSSVVHMSGCISSLLCYNESAKNGCVIMMLAHGLCSSGLFYLTGLVYNLTGSRSFFINKGLLNLLPTLGLWWFLLVACNMACPPTLNLLSEMKMMMGLLNYNWVTCLPTGLMVFLSCAYSIFLFSLSQHGKFLGSKEMFSSSDCLSYLVLILHWAPLNLFILGVYFLV